METSDILLEKETFYLTTAKGAGFNWAGYCVWENGTTCAKLVSRIGWTGNKGLEKAKLEIDRRISLNRG